MAPTRLLIHISRSEKRVLDPDDVYSLRARGGETEVRLRSRTPLVDVRSIGEVSPLFEPFGFVRIHREHSVNIGHVRLLRLQADGRDWELKLEPPVLKKAVAKDREGRYHSAHTLTRALEDVTLRVEGAEDLHPYPGLSSSTEQDAEYRQLARYLGGT